MKQRRITLPNGRRIRLPSKPLAPKRPDAAANRPRPGPPAAPRSTGASPAAQLPLPAISPESRPSPSTAPEPSDVKRWQINNEEKQQLLASISEVRQGVQDCKGVQEALATTGQPWIQHLPMSMLAPTEFERAQRRLIAACNNALRHLYRVRRDNISPTAIRSSHILIQIRTCCQLCRKVNLENKVNGRLFECLAHAHLVQANQPGFRYRLNEKGEIYE